MRNLAASLLCVLTLSCAAIRTEMLERAVELTAASAQLNVKKQEAYIFIILKNKLPANMIAQNVANGGSVSITLHDSSGRELNKIGFVDHCYNDKYSDTLPSNVGVNFLLIKNVKNYDVKDLKKCKYARLCFDSDVMFEGGKRHFFVTSNDDTTFVLH
jgi:hypothetical protein